MLELRNKLLEVVSGDVSLEKALEELTEEKREDFCKSLELLKKNASAGEFVKYDHQGQWSIAKAIKPGPTLDYSKINPKPDYKNKEANASTVDYSNKDVQVKKPWKGAAAKRAEARDRIDTRANQSALATIEEKRNARKKLGV